MKNFIYFFIFMFYRIGRTNCCSIASRSLIRSVVISRRPYSASSLMNQSFTSSHEMSEKRNVFRVFQMVCKLVQNLVHSR